MWIRLIAAPERWRIFAFQSHFSMSKISRICPTFFSLKNIKLGEELLLTTLFDYFHFEALHFCAQFFAELQSIQINFDEKIIGV